MSEGIADMSASERRKQPRNPYEIGLWILVCVALVGGGAVWMIARVQATTIFDDGLELLQTKDQFTDGLYELSSAPTLPWTWSGVAEAATMVFLFGAVLAVVLLVIRMIRWSPR